jgi:hypothetical protein
VISPTHKQHDIDLISDIYATLSSKSLQLTSISTHLSTSMAYLSSHFSNTSLGNLSTIDEFSARIHSLVSSVFDTYKSTYKENLERVTERIGQRQKEIETRGREVRQKVRQKEVEKIKEVEREVEEELNNMKENKVFEERFQEGFGEKVDTWVMAVNKEVF